MRRNSPLFGAAVLLVDVGAAASLFAVFRLVETGVLNFPALPEWLGCLMACYVILCCLLRKPQTQRTLLLVCAGFCVLQFVLAFVRLGVFAGAFGMVFSLGVWVASYYHAYTLALHPPKAETIMTSFEICVLILLFSLFYCSVQRIAFACALPAAVAAAVALVGLIGRRTASGREKTGGRGAVVVPATLGGFAFAALLLAGAAAGAIKVLVRGFWAGVRAVGGFLGRCISAFLKWLAALLPAPEPTETITEAPPMELPATAETVEQLVDPAVLLYVGAALAALIVLAAVIWLVIRGGGKLRRVEYNTGGRVTRRRQGPRRALGRWLQRLRETLRYHWHRLVWRNTTPGLFAALERQGALRRKGRSAGESCREYLLRLIPEHPGAEDVLLALAEDMDRHCFGPGSGLTAGDIRAMRKKLRAKEGS